MVDHFFSLIVVLTSLGIFISALGGFAVSLGMAAAAHITYRHSRWWSIAGGVAGGALIGDATHLVGVDTLRALFGQTLSGLTGAFEGAVIGAVVGGLGKASNERTEWHLIIGAALGTMCAGMLLTLVGGNLFSGSLQIVARSFTDSQLLMDSVASLFGEVRFGTTTQIIMGAIEGVLFGGWVMAGMEIMAGAQRSKLSFQRAR